MASVIIEEAISVGAPAYNAGNIALCAEIYEVAAGQLLSTCGPELDPRVVNDLSMALETASKLQNRGGNRGSPVDQLAWSFRQAFDAQLRQAATSRVPHAEQQTVADVVAQAVSVGAPTYNRGDADGCASIYMAAARELLERKDLSASARMGLSAALQQCKGSGDANVSAWTMRRALDAAAGGPLGGSLRASERSGGGEGQSSGDNLIRDFVLDDGIAVSSMIVNDTVMGGRSDGRVSVTDKGARFEGNVTKRGGGGFASVRFSPVDATSLQRLLSTANGVNFEVRHLNGCRAWKFQFLEGYDSITWQADFTAQGTGDVQRIPFSRFVPTWRGMPRGQPGLTLSALQSITSFGFMLSFLSAGGGRSSEFSEGLFAISILRIGVY